MKAKWFVKRYSAVAIFLITGVDDRYAAGKRPEREVLHELPAYIPRCFDGSVKNNAVSAGHR